MPSSGVMSSLRGSCPTTFRAPEIVFQPTMVGVDQSGLAETMDFVLQYYPLDVQQRLVQVLMTS